MKVAVVGAGLAGIASALRIAKLGHDVTLLERRPRVGGALVPFERDGFAWPLAGSAFTLPGALRDLFKKSGRPLDKELDLLEEPLLRLHHFDDGSSVALPALSRTAQVEAIDDALGAGLGTRWADRVAGFAGPWELLRRHAIERRYDPAYAPRELRRLLRDRATLAKDVKALKDPRLAAMATYHAVAEGQDPAAVPAWMGIVDHVEQEFGAWAVPGGSGQLVTLMERRLTERGVTVLTRTTVTDVGPGWVTTADERIEADAVVVAVDPATLPSLAPHVGDTAVAAPPELLLLMVESQPRLPHEIVMHIPGATVTVDTTGPGPAGRSAWTMAVRGSLTLGAFELLSRFGVNVFGRVAQRIPADDLVERWGGSPYGVRWAGRRTARLGVRTPLEGVYAAGAHTACSSLAPFVALSAGQVAAELPRVPRVAD